MDTAPFFEFLSEHGITYQRYDHLVVYTVNTATLLLSREAVARFVELTGHRLNRVKVPGRTVASSE